MASRSTEAALRNAGIQLSKAGQRTGARGAFQIRMGADSARAFHGMANIVVFMREVVDKVEPEFGADMPYSAVLEEATHPNHVPHIAPAITQNAGYIISQLQTRVSDLAVKQGHAGFVNVSAATREMEKIWDDILNAKPKTDAQSKAPVLFGFHRLTIGGHGRARSDSEVRALQQKLMSERELVRKTIGRERSTLGGG